MKFPEGFLIGASTAAHQVEGMNVHSDYWAQERMPHTSFAEPSGVACDHYNRYEEDIRLLADAGLNAYRFSVEWARVEPEEGWSDSETNIDSPIYAPSSAGTDDFNPENYKGWISFTELSDTSNEGFYIEAQQ